MVESKIEWTDRSDWNPIRGCTRVSPGCGGPGPHGGCYAEGIAARFSGPGQPFEGFAKMVAGKPRWTGKVELLPHRLLEPLSWRKPAKVFACSMSDLFHEALPDSAIDQVFAVMALCPHLTFQVLTKRADRMRGYLTSRDNPDGVAARIADATWTLAPNRRQLPDIAPPPLIEVPIGPRLADGSPEFGFRRMFNLSAWPLPNVWLGVSVERQQEADQRIPDMLATPAAVRFLSCEPLLSGLDIAWALGNPLGIAAGFQRRGQFAPGLETIRRLDWVIAGGESGPHARPSHPDWFRSLRDQCQAAGVAYFFKQWGEWAPWDGTPPAGACTFGDWRHTITTAGNVYMSWDPTWEGATIINRVGKARAGALLDGREWREMPRPGGPR